MTPTHLAPSVRSTTSARPLSGFLASAKARPILRDRKQVNALYQRMRMQMLVTLTLVYGFAYTCRLGLSVVKKPLLDAGIMTTEDLGMIGAAYLWAYGIGKFLNGFLADRVHPGRFIAAGLFLSALVNLCMGANTTVAIAVTLWGMNGIFQGTGAPASVVSITQWFTSRERGRTYGIWSAAHSIGEGLTFVGTTALVSALGWRAGFFGPGVVCIVVAIAAVFLLADKPETLGLPPVQRWIDMKKESRIEATATPEAGPWTADDVEKTSTTRVQLSVLKMPAVWVCGLASAFMYVTRYAVNDWGILYLQEVHGFSLVKAGSIIGISTVAGFLGSTAFGFISDHFFDSRRPPVTLLYGVVEVAALLLIFYGPPHPMLISVGFFVYGFTLSGILAVLGGLFAVDIAPKKAAGMAMGFVGVMSYLGAGLQEVVSGFLLHQSGKTIGSESASLDFTLPVLFWVSSSVLSATLAATLWRARAVD